MAAATGSHRDTKPSNYNCAYLRVLAVSSGPSFASFRWRGAKPFGPIGFTPAGADRSRARLQRPVSRALSLPSTRLPGDAISQHAVVRERQHLFR